ncbi:MAG: TetR/AcrR family transcriptional regulator [Alphaproteobacteria bacterium]|nr:TetR/AcrR family transcriptional regulator [Alphaproteobacteria bacterium]
MREAVRLGRPREFDEDTALEQILDVFWVKGFEGTSLSDLTAATGLQKGSLYAAFGDKRAMYQKAFALYDRTVIDGAAAMLTTSGGPERTLDAFLQSAIDAAIKPKDRRGCFLCNATVDQAAVDAETEKAVQASLGRLRRALQELLAKLPVTAIDADQRQAKAEHLLGVYFGLNVMAKAGHPESALKQAKDDALLGIRRDMA